MTSTIATPARWAAALGIAAAALSSVGVGAAGATPNPTDWVDGDSRFEMRISDQAPQVGETVTLTTTFQRRWLYENISAVKAVYDGCLRYVEGSGSWEGKAVAAERVSLTNADPGRQASVRLQSPGGAEWQVWGAGSGFGTKRTVVMDFVITKGCATGEPLVTGMHYGGNRGEGVYTGRGPSITVAPFIEPDPDPGENPGGGNGNGGNTGGGADGGGNGSSGSLDSGSLSSLFG